MSIAERVNKFITKHKPDAFCDDCIAEQLDLSRRQEANLVTITLATTDNFQREIDNCSLCREVKKVIRRA